MPELVQVLSQQDIDHIVEGLADKISADYNGCELVLIGVLNGAFIFLADLIRRLIIPAEVDFVRVASYGAGTTSSGDIRLTKGIEIDIRDKHVLVVEDIVDTGLTLKFIVDYVRTFNPESVGVCTLLDKLERRKVNINVNYTGHIITKGFLVGYGLDYNEKYRNMQGVCCLKL